MTSYYSFSSEESAHASRRLRGQGLSLPTPPVSEAPDMPADITELSDEELMELYSKLVTIQNFVTAQLAAAEVDERMCEKKAARLQAAKMGNTSDKTVSAAKARVASDPEVVVVLTELDSIYAYRKLVEAVHQNLDRNVTLASRELTRRTSSTPNGKRWP